MFSTIFPLGLSAPFPHLLAEHRHGSRPVGLSVASPSAAHFLGWMETGGWKDFSSYGLISLFPSETDLVPWGPCCHTVSSGTLTDHGVVASELPFPRIHLHFYRSLGEKMP